jgi:7-cyano-7-deazaguanine synthase in queuosine biosynthesis
MHITIPLVTPKGKPIKTIGAWVSGGADSALMLYLLAKQVKDNNLPITIIPCTVDHKRPHVNIAGNVVEKVIELLDCSDTIIEHQVYNPPAHIVWTSDELKQQFKDINLINFRTDKIQALFTGTTLNPPKHIQESFNYGILSDIELVRGVDVPKIVDKYSVHDLGDMTVEFIESRPFVNTDKKAIASLYVEHNLMDSLFPVTRSCEDLNTVRGHCGTCWWCEERLWGFGQL